MPQEVCFRDSSRAYLGAHSARRAREDDLSLRPMTCRRVANPET